MAAVIHKGSNCEGGGPTTVVKTVMSRNILLSFKEGMDSDEVGEDEEPPVDDRKGCVKYGDDGDDGGVGIEERELEGETERSGVGSEQMT